MSDGQVITGGIVSKTNTLNPQVAVFPDESVAVHNTFVTPTLNKIPASVLAPLPVVAPDKT